MASTNKTPQLGLNQWAAGDEVRRTDFNGDNAKLDAVVGRGSCITGAFIGDSVANRIVDLGFRPRMVILLGSYGDSRSMAVITSEAGYYFTHVGPYLDTGSTMRIADTGFFLQAADHFNWKGSTTHYVAFY